MNRFILFLFSLFLASCSNPSHQPAFSTDEMDSEAAKDSVVVMTEPSTEISEAPVDSTKIVWELPPYSGKLSSGDKKLHDPSSGYDIWTKTVYEEESMPSQMLYVRNLKTGQKNSYHFQEWSIGWLFPGNKPNTIYVFTVEGNRNGFSVVEFNIAEMKEECTLFQGIGIFAATKESEYFEIKCDGPWSIENGLYGDWNWTERYDFNGKCIYSADSLFLVNQSMND